MKNEKLGFFKNIALRVSSYFSVNRNNSYEQEKNELYNDFNKYLEVEDILFCLEMMETGLKPNIVQLKKLGSILKEKIFSKENNYKELEKYPNTLKDNPILHFPYLFDYSRKNEELSEEWKDIKHKELSEQAVEGFMGFMLDLTSYYKSGLDILQRFHNFEGYEVNKKIENFRVYKSLFKNLYDANLMDGESFMSFSKHLESSIKSMRLMTNKDMYMNRSYINISMDELEKTRLEMRDYVVKKSNPNEKMEILKKIKKVSSENLDNNIKKLAIHRNYSVNQLQEENKNQIKQVESLAERIGTQEVNDWLNARLPIILEKYLSIDPEYRTNLKNVEGFNAQELMSQSLENIINLLQSKLENKNYDFITELSVENRKLKVR